MQIYLHSEGHEDPELVEVDETITVKEFLVDRDGELLWIEEVDEAVAADLTFVAAGIEHRGHVHVGRCAKVEVSVRYGGETKKRKFAPTAHIRKVVKWATGPDGFNLSEDESAKHILELPGSDHRVPDRTHVGSVAHDCALVLDLRPKIRHEG
jgi:hypothetical protein